MNKFQFKAIPTFRIKDYQIAKAFYVDFLRFKIDWEHRFAQPDPAYMQVSQNGLVLHLSENVRFETHSVVFVETDGIEFFHQQITKHAGNNVVPAITMSPWKTRQLEITDPFGNLLRFNEEAVS